jgi:hypothetical protein
MTMNESKSSAQARRTRNNGGQAESKENGVAEAAKSTPAFSSSLATKKKIDSLLGTFDPFAVEMLASTRQRRVKDEQELDKLRVEMGALATAMEGETAKRTETARQLQTWGDEKMCTLRDHLLEGLHARMDGLDLDITHIHESIATLEAELAHEKETIPADIERRSAELTAQLTAFQEQFEVGRLGGMLACCVVACRRHTHTEMNTTTWCDFDIRA